MKILGKIVVFLAVFYGGVFIITEGTSNVWQGDVLAVIGAIEVSLLLVAIARIEWPN